MNRATSLSQNVSGMTATKIIVGSSRWPDSFKFVSRILSSSRLSFLMSRNPLTQGIKLMSDAAKQIPSGTLKITDTRTGRNFEVPIENDSIRAMDLRQIKVKD